MNTGLEEIKVFLSCPEDIVKNGIKDVIERVFEEDNIYFKNYFRLIFELKHWKKNVYLGKGTPRVQDVINEKLIKDCDIFLQVLWTRFGSPPGVTTDGINYSSGTEEEFHFAKKFDKKLWILFYTKPVPPLSIDPSQLEKIQKFREQLKKEQIRYYEFSNENELRKVLKENMSNFINEKYSVKIKEKENIQTLPSKADFSKYSRGF